MFVIGKQTENHLRHSGVCIIIQMKNQMQKICLKLEDLASQTPGTKGRKVPQIYTLLDLGQLPSAKQKSTLKKTRHSGVRDPVPQAISEGEP